MRIKNSYTITYSVHRKSDNEPIKVEVKFETQADNSAEAILKLIRKERKRFCSCAYELIIIAVSEEWHEL